MIRSKKRVARRKRLKKEGRLIDLPSNVSVKKIGPFPRYPPDTWVGDLDTSVKVFSLQIIKFFILFTIVQLIRPS